MKTGDQLLRPSFPAQPTFKPARWRGHIILITTKPSWWAQVFPIWEACGWNVSILVDLHVLEYWEQYCDMFGTTTGIIIDESGLDELHGTTGDMGFGWLGWMVRVPVRVVFNSDRYQGELPPKVLRWLIMMEQHATLVREYGEVDPEALPFLLLGMGEAMDSALNSDLDAELWAAQMRDPASCKADPS